MFHTYRLRKRIVRWIRVNSVDWTYKIEHGSPVLTHRSGLEVKGNAYDSTIWRITPFKGGPTILYLFAGDLKRAHQFWVRWNTEMQVRRAA
jgi:hypothetical protein